LFRQQRFTGLHDVIPVEEAPIPSLYGSPMGTIKANYVRELWGRNFDPAWTAGVNTQMAEAFNACLWEIIYETTSETTTWDVTSGTGFYATDIEEWATANSWLDQLDGNATYYVDNLLAISTPDGQDFLVQVPEPTTLTLLVMGSLLYGRIKKK
jgi:hypothetical protein